MHMQVMTLTVLSFIVICAVMWMFYVMAGLQKEGSKWERFEEQQAAPQTFRLKVMLFFTTWCPHCENYLKTGKYDTFSSKLNDLGINGVLFEKYDFDKNKALGEKYNIVGFPTIIAVDEKNSVYRFSGDRESDDDMVRFVQASLKGIHM